MNLLVTAPTEGTFQDTTPPGTIVSFLQWPPLVTSCSKNVVSFMFK